MGGPGGNPGVKARRVLREDPARVGQRLGAQELVGGWEALSSRARRRKAGDEGLTGLAAAWRFPC